MKSSTETTIAGRPVRITDLGRVRAKMGYRYYNLVSVTFLDTGERLSMGAGAFAKWADNLDRVARAEARP